MLTQQGYLQRICAPPRLDTTILHTEQRGEGTCHGAWAHGMYVNSWQMALSKLQVREGRKCVCVCVCVFMHICVCLCIFVCVYAYLCVFVNCLCLRGTFKASKEPTEVNFFLHML